MSSALKSLAIFPLIHINKLIFLENSDSIKIEKKGVKNLLSKKNISR